jgi:hypothetical protein
MRCGVFVKVKMLVLVFWVVTSCEFIGRYIPMFWINIQKTNINTITRCLFQRNILGSANIALTSETCNKLKVETQDDF